MGSDMQPAGCSDSRRRGRSALIALGVAGLTALGLFAPSAGAVVYWSDVGSLGADHTGSIMQASMDGSSRSELITQVTEPTAMAANSRHLFWANSQGIGRAKLDGTGVNESFVTAELFVDQMVANESYIYFTSLLREGVVSRIRVDGTGFEENFLAMGGFVAIDDTYIYSYTRDELGEASLGRAKLDGSELNPVWVRLTPNPPLSSYWGPLAVDDRSIYYTDISTRQIFRVDKSRPTIADDGLPTPDDSVFVASTGGFNSNFLGQVDRQIYYPSDEGIGRVDCRADCSNGLGVSPTFIDPLWVSHASGLVVTPAPKVLRVPKFTVSVPSEKYGYRKNDLKKGVLAVELFVPGPGVGELRQSDTVKGARQTSDDERGFIGFSVVPRGKAKATLARKGVVSVKATFTFRLHGGTLQKQTKKLKIRKRR